MASASQGCQADHAPSSSKPNHFFRDICMPHPLNPEEGSGTALLKDSKVKASASMDQTVSDEILNIVYQASQQAQHSCAQDDSWICARAIAGISINQTIDQTCTHASTSKHFRTSSAQNMSVDTGKSSTLLKGPLGKRSTCAADAPDVPVTRRRKILPAVPQGQIPVKVQGRQVAPIGHVLSTPTSQGSMELPLGKHQQACLLAEIAMLFAEEIQAEQKRKGAA